MTRLLAVAAAILLLASPAHAAIVATVNQGTLSVELTAADSATITCGGGNVKVNGADPTPATSCSAILSIEVKGNALANGVHMPHVSKALFPSLSGTVIATGGGDDVITGSGVPDTISAGAGADVVQLAFPAGPDEVTGDALDRVEIDGTAVDDTLEVHAAAPSAIVGGGISAPRNARVTSTGVGLIVLFGLGGDDSLAGDAGLAALGVRLVADGGDGDDRLRIDGTEGADVITVGAGGTVEVADVELVIVDGKAGDDTIDGSALSAATALSIAGGAGDDDLLGGDGDDTFAAALPAGVDHVQGGGGDDGVLYTGGKATTTAASSATVRARGSTAAPRRSSRRATSSASRRRSARATTWSTRKGSASPR
jgi:hypothetical protein